MKNWRNRFQECWSCKNGYGSCSCAERNAPSTGPEMRMSERRRLQFLNCPEYNLALRPFYEETFTGSGIYKTPKRNRMTRVRWRDNLETVTTRSYNPNHWARVVGYTRPYERLPFVGGGSNSPSNLLRQIMALLFKKKKKRVESQVGRYDAGLGFY